MTSGEISRLRRARLFSTFPAIAACRGEKKKEYYHLASTQTCALCHVTLSNAAFGLGASGEWELHFTRTVRLCICAACVRKRKKERMKKKNQGFLLARVKGANCSGRGSKRGLQRRTPERERHRKRERERERDKYLTLFVIKFFQKAFSFRSAMLRD